MGYDSCPPLYNTYEAKILRSKFCKEEKKEKKRMITLSWATCPF
jgi:hypothetical protein